MQIRKIMKALQNELNLSFSRVPKLRSLPEKPFYRKLHGIEEEDLDTRMFLESGMTGLVAGAFVEDDTVYVKKGKVRYGTIVHEISHLSKQGKRLTKIADDVYEKGGKNLNKELEKAERMSGDAYHEAMGKCFDLSHDSTVKNGKYYLSEVIPVISEIHLNGKWYMKKPREYRNARRFIKKLDEEPFALANLTYGKISTFGLGHDYEMNFNLHSSFNIPMLFLPCYGVAPEKVGKFPKLVKKRIDDVQKPSELCSGIYEELGGKHYKRALEKILKYWIEKRNPFIHKGLVRSAVET